MKSPLINSKDKSHQPSARTTSQQKKNKPSFSPFIDNRPIAAVQRKFQKIANDSARNKQYHFGNPSSDSTSSSTKVIQQKTGVIQRDYEFKSESEAIGYFKETVLPNLKERSPEFYDLKLYAEKNGWEGLVSLINKIGEEKGSENVGNYASFFEGCKDLKSFMICQDKYQSQLTSMEGLQSAGYEFEFASFFEPMGEYTKKEIIPSHQELGKSQVGGNYFNLPWKLESDSENTVELVTPPFVYPKDSVVWKKDKVNDDIKETVKDIPKKAKTLSQVSPILEGMGFGYGWKIEGPDYGVIEKQKGGPKVLAQSNVSFYPEEIGEKLEKRLAAYEDEKGTRGKYDIPKEEGMPIGVARMVRKVLMETCKEQGLTKSIQSAISIYARYSSNALAIPSMRDRQETGERKDSTATDIKETLGHWVKSDALNLLSHILKGEDRRRFIWGLKMAGNSIEGIFKHAGDDMMKTVLTAEQSKTSGSKNASVKEKTMMQILNELIAADTSGADRKTLAKQFAPEASRLFSLQKTAVKVDPSKSAPVLAMKEYVELMLRELMAFRIRVINLELHKEKAPTSTTKDFLEEKYGEGEGVRTGTYLENIPTAKGPMYVTELR